MSVKPTWSLYRPNVRKGGSTIERRGTLPRRELRVVLVPLVLFEGLGISGMSGSGGP